MKYRRNNKYRNEKVKYDGRTFDSQKECQRYMDLKLLERAGEIKDLRLQYKFVLQPGYEFQGKKIREITYIADFVYWDVKKGYMIVEDVKGYRTEIYKIKKKMFEFKYGIPIHEV
jgi:hypothetical protein